MSRSLRLLTLIAVIALDGGQTAPSPTSRPAPVTGGNAVPAAPPEPARGERHIVSGRSEALPGDPCQCTAEIRFCFACDRITAGAARQLRAFARTLPPHTRVRVEGHTDAVGSERYNDLLSRRRAEAAATILRDFPVRVSVHGYGESHAHGGRSARDRRVVLRAG